jgi:hypothetical protein
MLPNAPFREPAPPPQRTPPDALVFESPGAEQRLLSLRLAFSLACVGVVAVVVASETEAPVITLAVLVFSVASIAAQARRARRAPLLRLRVKDGSLWIEATAAPPARVALDTLREVEIEGKEARGRRHRGEAGPTIPTTVSEYGGVSRIVLVSEGGARTPLTPNYETYSACTERFGKVRVFLRAHGWQPAGERADVFREDAAAPSAARPRGMLHG